MKKQPSGNTAGMSTRDMRAKMSAAAADALLEHRSDNASRVLGKQDGGLPERSGSRHLEQKPMQGSKQGCFAGWQSRDRRSVASIVNPRS